MICPEKRYVACENPIYFLSSSGPLNIPNIHGVRALDNACTCGCAEQFVQGSKAFGFLRWKRPLQIGLPSGTPATVANAGVQKSPVTKFYTAAPQINK